MKIVAGLLLLSILVSPPIVASEVEGAVTAMARVGFCSFASFSPDAKEVLFVSNLSGSPQIWKVPTAGGWPVQLTALGDPVANVVWSPDGKHIAFTVAPGGGMNTQIYLMRPDGTDLRRITAGGKETNGLSVWSEDSRWFGWTSNNRNPQSMSVYFYDVLTSESSFIADLNGVGGISDFSRDRTKALIGKLRSRGSNDLYVRDLKTGEEVLLTAHEGPGQFGVGKFSPDGKTVYLSSNKDRDKIAFARVAAAGGPIEVLASREDAELQSADISKDGKLAILGWNVAGKRELTLFDLDANRELPTPKAPAEIASAEFSPDGRLIAITASGSASPSDIWIYNRAENRMWQLTQSPHAGVNLELLVRPALETYPAHDGLELSGWLYRPKGANGRGPIVLSFHGGPEGQETPGFRSDYQALVSRGISVFAPNVRGSSGFGKRFVNLDNGELRFNGIKDIASTVDFLVKKGIADPKRIGIMGGSYGGYMVMAGITEYPDMFAGAANLFGMVNFETFFQHTEPWMAAISTVEYGDPATQLELLQRLSPIHKIDRIKTPTIVLHGANDTNVPVVEAEQVVENLRRRNVPVDYVLFPDEGHGWRKMPNRIRSTVAIVDWFEKTLKP